MEGTHEKITILSLSADEREAFVQMDNPKVVIDGIEQANLYL